MKYCLANYWEFLCFILRLPKIVTFKNPEDQLTFLTSPVDAHAWYAQPQKTWIEQIKHSTINLVFLSPRMNSQCKRPAKTWPAFSRTSTRSSRSEISTISMMEWTHSSRDKREGIFENTITCEKKNSFDSSNRNSVTSPVLNLQFYVTEFS
jgi:hypothetical protein